MKKIIIISVTLLCYHISFTQKIGIGTTAPAEMLHVAGNIKADTLKSNALKLLTNAGAGKILTSDATGNASWQTNTAVANFGNIGFGVWGSCGTNDHISEYLPVADPTGEFGDAFGSSLALSGNFSIVGAPGDDIGTSYDQGSASIFQFNGVSWVFRQKLTDATGAANDQFGISVSISGNYAIVGAWQDAVGANANQGSASIYRFNGTTWVFMQKLIDATGAAGNSFGFTVSISGNRCIIGAFSEMVGANNFQGSASIYQYNGTAWVLMKKIIDAAGASNDNFGYSVSISGNFAIIGAPGYDLAPGYTDYGTAYFFKYNGSSWVLMKKIDNNEIGDGLRKGDWFGVSVSIDGNYAIIGAYQANLTPTNPDQGAAMIFKYDGSSWVFVQRMNNIDGKPNDKFGNSVAISGDFAIVGMYNHDAGVNAAQIDVGAASVYRRVGSEWQRIQNVADPGAIAEDWFGFSVAVDGTSKRFAIGAIHYINSSGKIVFGKIN